MKTRIAIALASLLLIAAPLGAFAQAEPSGAPLVDDELVTQLCTATEEDQAAIDACIAAVDAIVAEMVVPPAVAVPSSPPDIFDQIGSIVDDTLARIQGVDLQAAFDDAIAQAQGIDVQAIIDDAVAQAQGFDVQAALDEAVAAVDQIGADIDVQGAIDAAVAEALLATESIDLQATVDEALANVGAMVEDANVQAAVDGAVAALESGVAEAQAVVAVAQQWAQENVGTVCRGGSVSFGTTVGVATFVLTGVEWLGLQAFWAAERFSNGLCGDILQ